MIFNRPVFRNILLLITGAFSFVSIGSAQNTPDMAKGLSPFAEYVPSEIDNVNPANGNLFLKIPLVSFPQRGGKLRLDYYIYYNDKQWSFSGTPCSMQKDCPSNDLSAIDGQWGMLNPGDSFQLDHYGVYVAHDQYGAEQTNYRSWQESYGPEGYGQYQVATNIGSTFVETNDGSRHYIGDSFMQTCNPPGAGTCPGMPPAVYNTYPASDSSGWVSATTQSGVIDRTGILYSGLSSTDVNGNEIQGSSTGLIDTMGRTIPGTLTGPGTLPFPNYSANPVYNGDLVPGQPEATVPSECPAGTTAARIWNVPGSASYAQTVNYYFCYSPFSYQTAFDLTTVFPWTTGGYNGVYEANTNLYGTALLLTAIVLPDGGKYTFTYDAYLSLTQLTLPSGAMITYSWQNLPFAPGSGNSPVSRALLTRTIVPGDNQPSQTWTYKWALPAITSNPTTESFPVYSIVTDPLGNDVERQLGGEDNGGSGGTMWKQMTTVSASYYTGCGPHDNFSPVTCAPSSGSLIKSEQYTLSSLQSGGAAFGTPGSYTGFSEAGTDYISVPTERIKTLTTFPSSTGNSISEEDKTPTPGYGTCSEYYYPVLFGVESGMPQGAGTNAPSATSTTVSPCTLTGQFSGVSEYDYGAGARGALIRTTKNQYEWQMSNAFLNANMLDRIASSATFTPFGYWSSETDSCYDGHGNLTASERLTSASSSATPSCSTFPANALTSQTLFSSFGVPTQTIDPKGNSTLFSSFACNNSLPQSITLPNGAHEAYTYDCNTGKVTRFQDENGNYTSYGYSDPFSRVTSVTYPDGGGISVNYNGDALPLTMTVVTATGEASGPSVKTTTYDGLVRPIGVKVSDAIAPSSSNVITTYTNYDAVGRISSASNPYMSTSDPTYGFIVYKYDALGRKLSLTHSQDGTSENWSYAGNTVVFTNEVGSQWLRTLDALGRLTSVIEPSGSSPTPVLPTSFAYDALNNMVSVSQAGTGSTVDGPARNRTFAYDSLSRLIASYNPESTIGGSAKLNCSGTSGSWSTCYTYDGDSNLTSRTDARGITTIYGYDALNRVISKTYSGDTTGTPISCYQYDLSSVPNGIGRLANAWTQRAGSACTGSGSGYAPAPGQFLTLKSILSYDAMGRPTSAQQQQCIGASCSAPAPYSLSMAYDLAGNMTTLGNSVGASNQTLTLTNFYDSASRPCLTTSSWNKNFPANLFQINPGASSPGYAAFGGLQNWYLGSNSSTASTSCDAGAQSPISVTQTYNPRLWVTGISAQGQVP